MEIKVTKTLKSDTSWYSKTLSAVFVKNEKDVETVYQYLCEQDDYFESRSELVMVLPEEPTEKKLLRLLKYSGKTDIYKMDDFMKAMADKNIEVFVMSGFSEETVDNSYYLND